MTNAIFTEDNINPSNKPRGKFVVIEALDGAGKTTLVNSLKGLTANTLFTREPGGTPVGEVLRSILLGDNQLDPKTEILLHFAQRQEHIQKVILPSLKQGINVICERYTDSTFAYQAYNDTDGSLYRLASILNEELVRHTCKPDLVLVLDLPLEVALARLDPTDQYEHRPREFFESVYQYYKRRLNVERYRAIDALQSPTDVLRDALNYLNDLGI